MTEPQPPAWRRFLPLFIKLAVVAALAVWLLRGDDAATLWNAAKRLPITAMLSCLVLALALMTLGALRWGMLMRAFGARDVPGPVTLLRLVLIGLFYNTFVPGAVGGDIVRGVISRKLFSNRATPYVVVFLERIIGLSALGIVFLVGVFIGPALVDMTPIWPWIGALAGGGVLLLLVGVFTGRFKILFARLPVVERPAQLGLAFAISFVCHGLSLGVFAVLVWGLSLPIGFTTLLQVVPLGLIAAVIPLAIVGIGPREVALVGLLGLQGIPKGDALALSLGYAATMIVLAAIGGLLQLIAPPNLGDAPDAGGAT